MRRTRRSRIKRAEFLDGRRRWEVRGVREPRWFSNLFSNVSKLENKGYVEIERRV